MSYVKDGLVAVEDTVIKDALTRFEADNCIWGLQYKTSYLKNLCQIILEPSDLINPSYKNTAATAFGKVFTSRWIQSLNFRGKLEDELKDLFKNEFYEILLSEVSEDIKSTLKRVVLDVHKETWMEVWLVEELVRRVQSSDRIFLELLTNATTNYGNAENDCDQYHEVYQKLASLFASLMKKYLSSLPNCLQELQMLLKLYPSFVFENITRHIEEDLPYFVEKLEEFVLGYPGDNSSLSGDQLQELLAAKKQVFVFWSEMKFDDLQFIGNHSVHLYDTALKFIKLIPATKEYDEVFGASVKFIRILLVFHWEKMDFDADKFDQLFLCLVQCCLSSANMEEADFCIKEPRKYACHVLDRGAFDISKFKSSSPRRNSMYNLITYLIILRECIHEAVSRSVPNFLETCKLKNSDNILERDFYWNLVNSLNQDGDDDSSDNRRDMSKYPINLSDKFGEVLELLPPGEVTHPLLQCDALKFIILQRKQFKPEELNGILGALVDLLTSQYPAVTYFAAVALQRILWLKNLEYTKPVIDDDVLLHVFPKLFGNVMKILRSEDGRGHAFVISALKEALSNLNLKLLPFCGDLMDFLEEQILVLSETNAVDDRFPVYLYECVGHVALIFVHKSKEDGGLLADSFEKFFLPVFEEILARKHKNYVPLIGYIVMSTLLSRHESLTEDLGRILFKILSSDLWFRAECLQFLAYDFQLFVSRHPEMIDQNFLESMLTVCNRLMISQPIAFRALQIFMAMVESLDSSKLEPHLPGMMANIIEAFKINKEVLFLKGLVVFACFAVVKHGAEKILNLLDELDVRFVGSFVREAVFPVAKYTEFLMDRDITVEGLSLLVEHFAPLAVRDDDAMTLWVHLVLSLADVLRGFALRKMIGDRNADCYFRSFAHPLMYDYNSDLNLQVDWHDMQQCLDNRVDLKSEVIEKLKNVLERYPSLAQSSKFSDLKFGLEVRGKLKVIVRKNNLPPFPHLTYPDDPEGNDDDDDDDLCEFSDGENREECMDVDVKE